MNRLLSEEPTARDHYICAALTGILTAISAQTINELYRRDSSETEVVDALKKIAALAIATGDITMAEADKSVLQ